jgi:hypothetical protein
MHRAISTTSSGHRRHPAVHGRHGRGFVQADAKTRAAVEGKFLIIGEAASRLGDQAARLCMANS